MLDVCILLCFDVSVNKQSELFIRRVLRASKFSVSKLIGFVILWVYHTILFGF